MKTTKKVPFTTTVKRKAQAECRRRNKQNPEAHWVVTCVRAGGLYRVVNLEGKASLLNLDRGGPTGETDGLVPCIEVMPTPSRWIEFFKIEYLFTPRAAQAVENSDGLEERLKKIHQTIVEDMHHFVRVLTQAFVVYEPMGGPTSEDD